YFFFSSRIRHTMFDCDWSSDVCSSDLFRLSRVSRFALESRYNALIDVQRETLDSLKEGVAVFATDGRLKLFNSAVLQIWRLPRRSEERRVGQERVSVGWCQLMLKDSRA